MPKKKSKRKLKKEKEEEKLIEEKKRPSLHPDLKTTIWAVILLAVALVLFLSSAGQGGPIGNAVFGHLSNFLGYGYYLIPSILVLVGLAFLIEERRGIVEVSLLGALLFVLAGLGLFDIVFPDKGGSAGHFLGGVQIWFGYWASLLINLAALVIGFLIALNQPISIKLKKEKSAEEKPAAADIQTPPIIMPESPIEPAGPVDAKENKKEEVEPTVAENKEPSLKPAPVRKNLKNYIFPPLSLLKSNTEKPLVGDLRANANIIKRTLESFGIPVEMGEITIGPKVTRYTLKPAEGVRLTKITALSQDLSLALAAHPIRIEAPIPGKSLVGIELPNKTPSIVRLGSLLGYKEFMSGPPLSVPLGRDVSGEPIFANLAKMPHLLVAGATGSGKSVTIHSMLISLLYKNSPETLRLILIDPKRVELTIYDSLPHLASPVITQGKKSVAALRFAVEEMERRYETLMKAGKRDILGYNESRDKEPMPYLVIVIDELADLMAAFGREIEGCIVRLAQMARATGIHLIVSTQRPSVEVITGLIKANITSRIALQVASQIDSRTIIDSAGAEKLLGGGDMLFVSNDFSKPKRIQAAYLSEDEIHKVVDFISEKNPEEAQDELTGQIEESIEKGASGSSNDADDDLFNEAVEVVKSAGKASASLLQRRLKVGYARAARLLDLMEEHGLIGPGEGAKPREVFVVKEEDEVPSY